MDASPRCAYSGNMARTIQLRDVPERIRTILKVRAAQEGMSLSGYLNRELQRVVERPTMREWADLTRHAEPVPAKRRPGLC